MLLKAPYSNSIFSTLLLLLIYLTTTAQAQDISFFLATPGACKVPNYPCLGGQLCCPLPAVCIPDSFSGSLRYICVDAAGFPVNGGVPTTLPGGGLISPTTTVKISPVVISTLPSVLVPSPSPPGGVSVTPLSLPSITPISPPSTTISRFSTSTVPVPGSTTLGGGNGGGNGNGAATPVNPPTSIIATSIRPSSSSAGQSSGSGGGSGSGTGSPPTSIIATSIRPSSSSAVQSSGSGGGSGSGTGSGGGTGGGQGGGSGGNNVLGSGSGSTTNGTTGTSGSGNGTVSFKGGAAVVGNNCWGLIIAAGVIAGVGAIVVD